MSKDKKKKKKVHAENNRNTSVTSQLHYQTHYQLNNWTAMKSSGTVTIEFEYDGTRYRGTAYPVGDAQ